MNKASRANQARVVGQGKAGEGVRRAEILKTAAALFASSGYRVTLEEIASECGILAGSLYHHFSSKEKILEELVLLYQNELADVAQTSLKRLKHDGKNSDFERIAGLAAAIVDCASRHRAALLQTFFDPPTRADDNGASLPKSAHYVIVESMVEILQDACANGYIRKDIDVPKLAEQICQSMLNFAVGTFHLTPAAREVPRIKCRILLEGLFKNVPSNAELNRSEAFRAADATIAQSSQIGADERMNALREAARIEFGRRGFEGATIRDVATAAGMSTGSIYRMVGSKDKLLKLVMEPYTEAVTTSWDALMRSNSTPVEKLDAMLWTGVNLLDRFSEEFVIQLAWLRENPPLVWSEARAFGRRLRYIKKLLAEGERRREIRSLGASANILAYCLMELIWVPKSIVRNAGVWMALTQARETLLRGAIDCG